MNDHIHKKCSTADVSCPANIYPSQYLSGMFTVELNSSWWMKEDRKTNKAYILWCSPDCIWSSPGEEGEGVKLECITSSHISSDQKAWRRSWDSTWEFCISGSADTGQRQRGILKAMRGKRLLIHSSSWREKSADSTTMDLEDLEVTQVLILW